MIVFGWKECGTETPWHFRPSRRTSKQKVSLNGWKETGGSFEPAFGRSKWLPCSGLTKWTSHPHSSWRRAGTAFVLSPNLSLKTLAQARQFRCTLWTERKLTWLSMVRSRLGRKWKWGIESASTLEILACAQWFRNSSVRRCSAACNAFLGNCLLPFSGKNRQSW